MFAKFTLFTNPEKSVYINPDKVESVLLVKQTAPTSTPGTCVSLSGKEDDFFVVKESVEDVVMALAYAMEDRYRVAAQAALHVARHQ